MIILKEHVKDGVLTISLCDSDLLGKVFEESNLCLDLRSHFYSGEECNAEKAIDSLKKARSASVVGESSVKVAKSLFHDVTIKEISKIPFMNIMKI